MLKIKMLIRNYKKISKYYDLNTFLKNIDITLNAGLKTSFSNIKTRSEKLTLYVFYANSTPPTFDNVCVCLIDFCNKNIRDDFDKFVDPPPFRITLYPNNKSCFIYSLYDDSFSLDYSSDSSYLHNHYINYSKLDHEI